jgi:hypothetical protein
MLSDVFISKLYAIFDTFLLTITEPCLPDLEIELTAGVTG